MRHRWLCSLALSLGVVVMDHVGMSATGARAGETTAPFIQPYPPVKAPASPVGQAFQPDLQAGGSDLPTVEAAEPVPAARLDRPVALPDEQKEVDSQVLPTGLFLGRGSTPVSLNPEGPFGHARPLPVGPSSSSSLPMPAPVLAAPPPADVPYSWRQPPTSSTTTQGPSLAAPAPLPSASKKTDTLGNPTPLPGSLAAPGVGVAPGVVTGPMGAPLVDGCVGDFCCPPDCCDALCDDGCCGLWNGCWGSGCCFGNRWYGSAEYLLWFIRGQSVPPLLTSGSVAGSPPGALGQPGTNVLFGNSNLANNPYSGLRLRGGYWFNDHHGLGLDVGAFILGGSPQRFTASSLGIPFLARPFVNALTGAQDIEAVATPNGLTGTFSATSNFFLFGTEVNLRRNLCCGCNWFIDGFAGWRMLGLNESLAMSENLTVISSANPALPAGSRFLVGDRFGTTNLFNGAQIGAIGEYRLGRWIFDLRTSVALGGTMQFANISGSTTSQAPGAPSSTAPGGLLALPSNMGRYTRGMVTLVEEVGFNVGYQFTNHIRGFVGYNFLFWSSVVRPAEQIDTVVNPNLIPPTIAGGPARPKFSFNGSDFWVQGINLGLDIRW